MRLPVILSVMAIASLPAMVNAADVKGNKAPIGFLDAPAAGTVKGKTRAFGWAVDEDGKVTKAELLLDGKEFKTVKLDTPRPDVCTTYKVPTCPKVGFDTTLDFSKVKKGHHTMALRLIDSHRAKAEIGKRDITVE